jgi:carboxylate-amine ligase
MRAMRVYLPVLLALAANSPYWRGHETDCASYRHRILAATRSYGIPPIFDSWEHFSGFFRSAERAGLFTSVKDIHWDIRPQPKFGTIELRIMDAQSDIRHVAELAALIRALVVHIVRDDRPAAFPIPLPWWSEKENHFQAAQKGLDAVYICHPNGATMPLREVCETVIATMKTVATEQGDGAYLEALQADLLARPGYLVQRETLRRRGEYPAVVEERIADFTASFARAPLGEANPSGEHNSPLPERLDA